MNQAIICTVNVFIKLIQLKPKLIVVNTFELLIVTIVNQIIFGGKIVYDLQENYYRNLVYQNNFPHVIKHIFGSLIRLKEILLSPVIDHFILAENVYQKEIHFIKHKFTVIENKATFDNQNKQPKTSSEKLMFLFSGNLSENSGVLTALSFL